MSPCRRMTACFSCRSRHSRVGHHHAPTYHSYGCWHHPHKPPGPIGSLEGRGRDRNCLSVLGRRGSTPFPSLLHLRHRLEPDTGASGRFTESLRMGTLLMETPPAPLRP